MPADLIDIVIPVYRNHLLTRRCVDSVLRAQDPAMGSIYLINDASPDADLVRYCQQIADGGDAQLIEHEKNKGFVRSVNEGFLAAGDRDVVILNSDTEVPSKWLSRLKAAADQHPKAASITPFSNNATICSYPNMCEDNELPDDLDLGSVDSLFATVNPGKVIEIPTGVGFCMYIRRAAIEDVGLFDDDAFGRGYGEENDWCLRATARGWHHLLCADLFVYHAGGVSFQEEAAYLQENALKVISERYPEYERDISQFVETDPIEVARYNVDIVRPDAKAVIQEYRGRERALRASRYALDRERHQQVSTVDSLLQCTREEAKAQSERYEALLSSQRKETAASEAQYRKQLDEMAGGYASLEQELQGLQRFWPVRLRNWVLRRLER